MRFVQPIMERKASTTDACCTYGGLVLRPAAWWLACTLIWAAADAHAHDSWLSAHGATARGEAVVALQTGHRFPRADSAPRIDRISSTRCSDDQGRNVGLRWMADAPTQLWMRTTQTLALGAPLECRAELAPETLTLTDEKIVAAYLEEIRAPQAVHQHWAHLRSQGLPWNETYSKRARIVTPGLAMPTETLPGLDIRLEATALRVGDTAQLQVLMAGKPHRAQMLEWRSELSSVGIWRASDAQGRMALPLPLPGRWLVRGVHLLPSADAPERWESQFITLSFEVLPALPGAPSR